MGYLNRSKASLILLVTFTLFGFGLFLGIDGLFYQATSLDSAIRYDVVERSQHQIHTVTIPHDSNYSIVPAVSALQPIKDFVQDDHNIVAAINGGYFDPINHKTTSFVSQDSRIIADPRFNERLVDNQDLKQYLPKIFNRAELRTYSCNSSQQKQYDIQLHSAPIPPNCTLKASLGGGPGLLPENTSEKEAFIAYQNGKKIRDAIGTESLNARSAIAITAKGDIILAMVAQKPQYPLNSGISLTELTDFLSNIGAVKAMNLDGGSSSALYYDGRVVYGKVDRSGQKIKRPIKSVLLVKRHSRSYQPFI